MGNLIQNMSESEYSDLVDSIKKDKELGKPESHIIQLSVFGKSSKELIKMKNYLSEFYDKYNLNELDKWIKYLKKINK